MASLRDAVVPHSDGMGAGCGGGNPGGALGDSMGIWDALTFLISLIQATNTFKYPSSTSSSWLRDLVSNGFNNALSSSGVHFRVGPSRQVSSSIGIPPAALSIVASVVES